MDNLLSITIFIPAIAAAILGIFLRGDDPEAQGNAKWVAFIASTMTFVVSLFIIFEFEAGDAGFQFVEEHDWPFGLTYKVGVDGISLALVLLTTFLMPLIIAGAWRHVARTKGFMIALLVLETLILGAFLSLDLVFFFLFAEGALIPLLVILGIWGGDHGRLSAIKLVLYVLPGAVLMLVAMVTMAFDAQTTDMEALLTHQFSADVVSILGINALGGAQTLLALAFLLSFAVKLPLWPLHAWVASTHMRLPPGASIVLAALLMKIGAYGFLRFMLPMFPEGVMVLSPVILWLSVITILYAAIVALVQTDMVRLITYAGVAHIGFVTLGIFAANQQGLDGAVFQMVSHGLVMAALMLVLSALYDRVNSTEIAAYGGVAMRMPVLAFGAIMFTLAALGVPGTSGFVGVFLTMVGMFQQSPFVAALALLGLVISAGGLLSLFKRVVFGPLIKQSLKTLHDLDRREGAVFAVLLAMILYLGLFPGLITDRTGATVEALVIGYEEAQAAARE
ncbi:MAG: NADH-quinone oxidoreductase subunit M [Pseudomonadota bacterium]